MSIKRHIFDGGLGYEDGLGPGAGKGMSVSCDLHYIPFYAYAGGGAYAGYATPYLVPNEDEIYAVPYGDIVNPSHLGSGGGGYHCSGTIPQDRKGGRGGGLIKINTDELILEGEICADGTAPLTGKITLFSGGGSGGGIDINVRTIEGIGGIIRADGGSLCNDKNYCAGGSAVSA